jgi:hypothetical protein
LSSRFQTTDLTSAIRDAITSGDTESVENLCGSCNESEGVKINRYFKAKILQFAVVKGSLNLVDKFHAAFDLCKTRYLYNIVFPACRARKPELLTHLLQKQGNECKCYIAWKSIEEMLFHLPWDKLTSTSLEYQTLKLLFEYTEFDTFCPCQERLIAMGHECLKYPCLIDLFSPLLGFIQNKKRAGLIETLVRYENVQALKIVLASGTVGQRTNWVLIVLDNAIADNKCAIIRALFEMGFIRDVNELEDSAFHAAKQLSPEALELFLSFRHQCSRTRPQNLEQIILTAVECRKEYRNLVSVPRELKVVKEFCTQHHYSISKTLLEKALKIAEGYKDDESVEMIQSWLKED